MTGPSKLFEPALPLLPGLAARACRACVTIPARNEAGALQSCLQALENQRNVDGAPLPAESFEILLLLNNCEDGSAEIARQWAAAHPQIALHLLEITLPPESAHVGTARRLLMDTAWARLAEAPDGKAAILTTDADSCVAPDWVAQNLQALEQGADVVGGLVRVRSVDLRALPVPVRHCYEQDRRYAEGIARLEALLDPCKGDPWPRHLDHFGSSLACAREAYAEAGGMPAVTPLEDEAFVDRVRRADLVLRHEPKVVVWTSARLEGRATIGLAGQFRLWNGLADAASHRVQAASFLEHRFRMLHRLRRVYRSKDAHGLELASDWWRNTFRDALATETTCAGFLGAVFCDTLVEESYQGEREESIAQAIAGLQERIDALQGSRPGSSAPVRPPENVAPPCAQLPTEDADVVQ